jgi:hypothetical protein
VDVDDDDVGMPGRAEGVVDLGIGVLLPLLEEVEEAVEFIEEVDAFDVKVDELLRLPILLELAAGMLLADEAKGAPAELDACDAEAAKSLALMAAIVAALC